jgi:hypothetical protein
MVDTCLKLGGLAKISVVSPELAGGTLNLGAALYKTFRAHLCTWLPHKILLFQGMTSKPYQISALYAADVFFL